MTKAAFEVGKGTQHVLGLSEARGGAVVRQNSIGPATGGLYGGL